MPRASDGFQPSEDPQPGLLTLDYVVKSTRVNQQVISLAANARDKYHLRNHETTKNLHDPTGLIKPERQNQTSSETFH